MKPLGPIAYIIRARVVLLRDLGPALSPFNAFQIIQGLETLPLRIARHCENAAAVVKFLSGRKDVTKIIHPAMATGIEKERVDKYLPRGQGGLLGFELAGGRRPAKNSSPPSSCSIMSPISAMRAASRSIPPAPRIRSSHRKTGSPPACPMAMCGCPSGLSISTIFWRIWARRWKQQSKVRGRFLKKAAQKFLRFWACGAATARAQTSKVFLLLFVHKK